MTISTFPMEPVELVDSSQRGFTLIEILIAVALLSAGVTASSFVFGRALLAANSAEEMEQAVALAQEKLENLRGTAFASIVSESKAAVSGWTGFSREVTVTQPSGTNSDFKQVVATLYWNTTGGEDSTALTTLMTNVANN
jgi:prepilin-type N-terminal cleavage/methylation domain-containing protein